MVTNITVHKSSVDIDTIDDFEYAEYLLRKKRGEFRRIWELKEK